MSSTMIQRCFWMGPRKPHSSLGSSRKGCVVNWRGLDSDTWPACHLVYVQSILPAGEQRTELIWVNVAHYREPTLKTPLHFHHEGLLFGNRVYPKNSSPAAIRLQRSHRFQKHNRQNPAYFLQLQKKQFTFPTTNCTPFTQDKLQKAWLLGLLLLPRVTSFICLAVCLEQSCSHLICTDTEQNSGPVPHRAPDMNRYVHISVCQTLICTISIFHHPPFWHNHRFQDCFSSMKSSNLEDEWVIRIWLKKLGLNW